MTSNKNRTNQEFFLEYALNTSENIFLTGKAGTGKTTLLKKVIRQTEKNVAVVAPTGVAAINAGGMTIHSMFQLPTTGFIPTDDQVLPQFFTNRITLARTQRMRQERRRVLLELELLIIDEISMVRADLLDAVDSVLKRIRKDQNPFGGVQVIVIGDLFQLSPVIRSHELLTIKSYYDSPFFFDSNVWKQCKPVTIELNKIFRQDDAEFISILNNIRVGKREDSDLLVLNQRVSQDHDATGIITLTTHNAKADKINNRKLDELKNEEFELEATIKGKFAETAFPVKECMKIKVGSQVMFIRNHPDQLYYNGKIGIVKDKIENEVIIQSFDDNSVIHVSPVEWKNYKYTIDPSTKQIEKEDIGSFIQYPLKLAWAVTVHKSQGLTFRHANLDLADTFAPGQLYVALSRCQHLDGINLSSRIMPENIIVNERLLDHFNSDMNQDLTEAHLIASKENYEDAKLLKAFDFAGLRNDLENWFEFIEDHDLPEQETAFILSETLIKFCESLIKIGIRFTAQLNLLLEEQKGDARVSDQIFTRTRKAIDYFTESIHDEMAVKLQLHYDEFYIKKGVIKYLRITESLLSGIWKQIDKLYNLHYRRSKFHTGPRKFKRTYSGKKSKGKKTGKGATYDISMRLLKDGLSLSEIAKQRSMALGTIEGHMLKLIRQGKVELNQIMAEDRIKRVSSYAQKYRTLDTTQLKNKIPFDTSYSELRWVKAAMEMATN